MTSNWQNKIVHIFNLLQDRLFPERKKTTGIVAEAREALRDWKHARILMDHADSEMIDYAIYHLNATEKRFVGLLQKARDTGLTAWEMDKPEENRK